VPSLQSQGPRPQIGSQFWILDPILRKRSDSAAPSPRSLPGACRMHRTQLKKTKKYLQTKEIICGRARDCGLKCGSSRKQREKLNDINARWRMMSASAH